MSAMLLLAACVFPNGGHADSRKRIVGATEVVRVEEAGLDFEARVDTGAKTSSIHAEDIRIGDPGAVRGAPISFRLVDAGGRSKRVDTVLDSTVTVRTSEGSERRYKVLLTLTLGDSRKTVPVTLNDRRRMQYRLLLGRNWLQGDFLVDVDRNAAD